MTETPSETDPTVYCNPQDARPLAGRIARHWMPRRPRLHGIWAFLGPGLITGASDDDPSGIATYSQVGAQFGYSMAWVMLFTWPLMAAIQEISARIGRVTGEGIAGNIREHYPRWLLLRHRRPCCSSPTSSTSAPISARWAPRCSCCWHGSAHLYVVGFAVGLRACSKCSARYENYVAHPEMDGSVAVRLCRDGAGGRRAVGQGRL